MNIQNVIETSTSRQINNGTRQFFDTITGRTYASYKSGYVRRLFKSYYKNDLDMYYINQRNKNKKAILIHNENDRLELIQNHINNTRLKMM